MPTLMEYDDETGRAVFYSAHNGVYLIDIDLPKELAQQLNDAFRLAERIAARQTYFAMLVRVRGAITRYGEEMNQ